MSVRLLVAVFLCLAGLGDAGAAEPGASDWARTDQSAVRLVSATTAASETLRLGIEFRLAPGWKTYWRSPGDAGYPVRVDWAGSRNLVEPELRWPAPARFELFGLDTFGYGGTLILPVEARAAAGAPVAVRAKVEYLICETICIPYEARLALDLPAGTATLGPQAHAIDRFVARVPGDGAAAGLSIERAEWRGTGRPGLLVEVRTAEPFNAPDIFVEGAEPWVFGKPEVRANPDGTRATMILSSPAEEKAAAPIGRAVKLTLVDGERAMERTITVTAAESGAETGFLLMLGVALLGGLILNLMPCVLPVLSLKLFGFLSQAGADRRRVRASFLATGAGIVSSFALLAGGLIALRAGGMAIGWGIQFQSPAFLAGMAVVLVVFAANLWGWFEIRLPSAVTDVAGRAGRDDKLSGAFLTGVFATLLATPCSAPFVGTAVGFALSRGAAEIVLIFLALGIGLAAPYLAVAIFPGSASRLPRPGRWMVPLRWILGFALLATAVWLLDVLLAQRAWSVVAAMSGVLMALLALLWATRRASAAAWLRPSGVAAAAVAVLALSVLGGTPVAGTGGAAGARLAWAPFSGAAVAEAVAAGRVVFVDVTADWCVTCQINKRLVLDGGRVAPRLEEPGIVLLKADWTRPDDRIARFLEGFGRYGVPFNVVYGPAARDGIPLPELLTADVVLAALDRAKGGS